MSCFIFLKFPGKSLHLTFELGRKKGFFLLIGINVYMHVPFGNVGVGRDSDDKRFLSRKSFHALPWNCPGRSSGFHNWIALLQWHSLAVWVYIVFSFVGTRKAASMPHLSILISIICKKNMKKSTSRKEKNWYKLSLNNVEGNNKN